MALNSGKILMRRGQEINFDANQMTPGEWAVSLDSRYVRMCFAPGVCVRMATYDAFEADMVQIQRILAECQTVEEAVQRIYEDIKDVAVDVERIEAAAASALESEENALNSANLAVQSAETAMQKAEEAEESANIASAKAEQATEGARIATEKANEAADSAENVRNMSDVSQSYAVGGTGTREGEDTDNAKYYNQQASDNATRAEEAAERAAAVADVGVATTEKAGIVKPDGTTVTVDPDGTIHVKEGTKNYNDLENKPKINGVELSGELTTEDLNLNPGGGGGTSNYEDLENKPHIGGVELSGNQTPDELGLVGKTDFEEFSNQTTEAVENLETGLERTTFKVDTIIEKADLGIKETASGEHIHLDDSADGKVVEFSLYGKARQETTTGKQLIPYPFYETTKTINGVTFTDNGDGTVKANGTNSSEGGYALINLIAGTGSAEVIKSLGAGSYVLNGCPNGGSAGSYRIMFTINTGGSWSTKAIDYGSGAAFELTDDEIANITEANVNIRVYGTANNLTFYPMIRLSSISDGTWEPYTGGIPSPSPEYPQEIVVAGESYNLLENTAEGKSVVGIDYTVNEDGTVIANGTVTSTPATLQINNRTDIHLNVSERYILSGAANATNCFIKLKNDDTGAAIAECSGTNETTFVYNGEPVVAECLVRNVGTKVENAVFKPMIRKASIPNNRYMPYGVGSVEVKSVGKNLLKNAETSQTANGITFTVNKDGSVTANGTATDNADFVLFREKAKDVYKYNGCILSGSIGGSFTSYEINFFIDSSPYTSFARATNGDANISGIPNDDTFVKMHIRIRSGITVNNVTFYPMIRLATDTNNTYQPYREPITATIQTENGFAGIPVDSGGNYTDQSGQQWICDEIVKYEDGSGKKIQRIGIFENYNSEEVTGAYISTTGKLSTGAKVIYQMSEPIRTPLTAEQITEIEKLYTFYPVTHISNDFDAEMRVKYKADAKSYIDKRLELLTTAIINSI